MPDRDSLHSITVEALAVGYSRGVQIVSPIANATRNFGLTPGPTYLEPETDMAVTYQQHPRG